MSTSFYTSRRRLWLLLLPLLLLTLSLVVPVPKQSQYGQCLANWTPKPPAPTMSTQLVVASTALVVRQSAYQPMCPWERQLQFFFSADLALQHAWLFLSGMLFEFITPSRKQRRIARRKARRALGVLWAATVSAAAPRKKTHMRAAAAVLPVSLPLPLPAASPAPAVNLAPAASPAASPAPAVNLALPAASPAPAVVPSSPLPPKIDAVAVPVMRRPMPRKKPMCDNRLRKKSQRNRQRVAAVALQLVAPAVLSQSRIPVVAPVDDVVSMVENKTDAPTATPTENQTEKPNETPTEAPTQTPETTQTPTTTTALPQQHPRPNTPTKNQAEKPKETPTEAPTQTPETTQTPTTTTALPQQPPTPKEEPRSASSKEKMCSLG